MPRHFRVGPASIAATLIAIAAVAAHAQQRSMNADPIGKSTQILVVTTADWTATSGTMRRFERRDARAAWTPVGAAVPVVVGRTGLALGVGFDGLVPSAPAKREGDGKAPAGVFPLGPAFGFEPAVDMRNLKIGYTALTPGMDCVDDTASRHYNSLTDRARVESVDWNSAEHMREVGQYEHGVVVEYNMKPRAQPGRGSCIFLHIWAGPASHTAGCTAFDVDALRQTIAWLDRKRSPRLVQFPAAVYATVRERWGLPE
jgi:D-alanyl-D-alanine dipeptidase